MKLELENVGKIGYANIELNGITVIAGENNTGKSTVGKMLFCIFHAFYKIDEKIREEREKSIYRILRNFYLEALAPIEQKFDELDLAARIVWQREMLLGDKRLIMKEIENFFANTDKHINQEALEVLAEKIYTFLSQKDSEIQQLILQKRLEAEFAMKVGHLNRAEQRTTVKLNIKDSYIHFDIVENKNVYIFNYMSLNKEIIYMDDPFSLDNYEKLHWRTFSNPFEHRQDLLNKLAIDKITEEFSVVDELVVQKKLENIFKIMGNVCDGNIMSKNNNSFIYKTDGLKDDLEMMNLSTGMKSFAILRRLLQNGNITENGIIILDEPEIHLHPEWQLKFAEIIVMIQKEFGMNILLNTHSPYFLNAIEAYSEKYKIDHKCKYYLTNEEKGTVSIMDVTSNTEKIYAKLAKPFQELENMEYGNTKV